MDNLTLSAHFEVNIASADALLPGTSRFDFTKTWTGAVVGTSSGVMLSAGDPASGAAGYVAIEVFEGSIQGRSGRVSFQQLGSMADGVDALEYQIVPGSATGELVGLTGELTLDAADGEHKVVFSGPFRLAAKIGSVHDDNMAFTNADVAALIGVQRAAY